MEQNDKDILKNEIDSLINGESNQEFPEFNVAPIEPLNVADLDAKTRTKAQKIVLSCLKLYFDEKVISKNEFMAAKSAVTTGNIKTLFRQIKIAEHMIDKIVNRMDNADELNPRLYEVAGQLQGNIVDMLKNVQLHVISMQEEFRRMQSEIPKISPNDIKTIDITNNSDDDSPKAYTNAKALLNDLDDEEDDEEDTTNIQ